MVDHLEEIVKIIQEEYGIEYFSQMSHNPSYTIFDFAGLEIMVKNDIEPQEFREKTAQAFLDNVQHHLKVAQTRLVECQKEVKELNKIYNHYHDIVADISAGRIETLEPINWKTHKRFM